MHDVVTHSRIMMNRTWAMPSASTFTIKPIRELVKRYMNSAAVSVDPFARNCRWATHTNDLNPKTAANHHLFAKEFLELMIAGGVQADVILFDPPYSTNQIVECYGNIGLKVDGLSFQDYAEIGHWSKEKDLMVQLLKPAGYFLQFGWHTNGLGLKRGCELKEILLVAHGRCHNDTICTVEQKTVDNQAGLFSSLCNPANEAPVPTQEMANETTK